ncbi:Uu.00g015010.m01.CDS01 [Anthostomella pinea]|uniref:Uu.00g015010.m01.CDS01 n=1 Tax=Anthostomella pinea TaxID=933095 RepID=A0AAI8YN53_9PEZI|nr:Uu.00g015010.m01.CDS01 [Anthostomella pinea]
MPLPVTQALAAGITLGTGTVQATTVGTHSVPHATPRVEDPWTKHMADVGYPADHKVCQMVANQANGTWAYSKASDYYLSWMKDHGNKLDDWVQGIHKNATADSGITPSDIDCTILHTQNCQPPHDGDCEKFKPAAFDPMLTEVVNLYGILEVMDITNIKETLLTNLDLGTLVRDFIPESMIPTLKKYISITAVVGWLISGIFGIAGLLGPAGVAIGSTALVGSLTALTAVTAGGAFVFNTIGAILSITSTALTDTSLDPGQMEAHLGNALGNFFDAMSARNAALTAKIFGGTPDQDIDLMEFVTRIDDRYKKFENATDSAAVMYLLQNGWFMEQSNTADVIEPMFDAGFKLMKVGLIGYMFSARRFYVMQFTKLNQTSCQNNFDGASRFVDGGCFVLKIGDKKIDHNDNAGTELKTAESKYNLVVPNFFRNVRDCDNNADLMQHKNYTMDNMGEMGKCFFGLDYLHVETPDDISMVNKTIADSLDLDY